MKSKCRSLIVHILAIVLLGIDMVKSGMALFRRGKKYRITPSEHIALLYVQNDYRDEVIQLDLSALTQAQLYSVIEYAQELPDMDEILVPADTEVEYEEDE